MKILREYKLFVQRIGILGISNILVGVSGIILLPILTKNLSILDYGTWIQVNITILLLSIMGNFGLSSTMVRFLAVEQDKIKIQEVFYTITFFVIVSSAIISFLFYLFSKTIAITLFNGNMSLGILIPLIVFISCLNVIFINYFRTFQQMKRFSIFTILQTYLNIVLISYFIIKGYGLIGALIGFLLTQILLFVIMTIFIYTEIGFKVPKFKNLKRFLSFGVPTVPGNLSYWIVDSSDRYVIGLLLGVIFVGFYSPGYTLGNIINMLSYPFSLMLPAVLANYYDKGDIIKVETILNYSFKYFLVIAIPSTIGLSLLSKPILLLLSTPEIASNGYLVTPFVALGGIFLGSYTITSQSIILKKKTKIIGTLWFLTALLNLGLNIIFVPFLGIIGAAATTLGAYIFAFAINAFYSFKYIKFEIDFVLLAKSVLATILIAVIILILNPKGVLQILLVVVICIIVYFIALLALGVNKKEIDFLRGLF